MANSECDIEEITKTWKRYRGIFPETIHFSQNTVVILDPILDKNMFIVNDHTAHLFDNAWNLSLLFDCYDNIQYDMKQITERSGKYRGSLFNTVKFSEKIGVIFDPVVYENIFIANYFDSVKEKKLYCW